jgi:hypothetical protein
VESIWPRPCLAIGLALLAATSIHATRPDMPDMADHTIRRFLARADASHQYRAFRRLEAENGDRMGWLEAKTEYSPSSGFRYQVLAEGGSSYIRAKVLRAVLDAEQDFIAGGEAARSTFAASNYTFHADGVDAAGLAHVILSPRRRERALVSGTMFLQPSDGGLVRLEGRLAKSPSFWVRNVDIVRTYARICGAIVPVALESTAQLRFLGVATLRMTYLYSEIDGRSVVTDR